ncbi:MAG: GNAT family N-acetyltransferase [Planctomycetota bacterium]
MGRYTIRAFLPGDEEAILRLHNLSFSEHEERTRRHWTWKFRENPLGRTEIMLAVAEDGRCVGVWPGVTHRFVLDNQPCLAGNHLDLAVDPELRRGIAGARLLTRLGRAYYRAYTGGETRVTWGLPEPQLQRLGLRLIKFQVLRDVVFLVREPGPTADPPEEVEVRSVEEFGAEAEDLWRRCSNEVGTGIVRDAAYLNWRYARHPDHDHLLLEARDRNHGSLRGIAVLREGGWDDSIVSMLDWLVPLEDRAAERALVQYSLRETARLKKPYLAAWFPAPTLQFSRFQNDHGFCAQATPYQACFRGTPSRHDRRWMERNWYQTMGDIDFF